MVDLTVLQAAVDAAKSALDASPEDPALKEAMDAATKALTDAQEASTKNKKKQTEARVLVATAGYAVDAIITGDAADEAVAGGWADKTPAAVAYAKSLA